MKTCRYCGTPRTKKRFSLSSKKCDFCIMKELAKEELLANKIKDKTEYPPPNPTLVEKRRKAEKARELKEIDEDLEI